MITSVLCHGKLQTEDEDEDVDLDMLSKRESGLPAHTDAQHRPRYRSR